MPDEAWRLLEALFFCAVGWCWRGWFVIKADKKMSAAMHEQLDKAGVLVCEISAQADDLQKAAKQNTAHLRSLRERAEAPEHTAVREAMRKKYQGRAHA